MTDVLYGLVGRGIPHSIWQANFFTVTLKTSQQDRRTITNQTVLPGIHLVQLCNKSDHDGRVFPVTDFMLKNVDMVF